MFAPPPEKIVPHKGKTTTCRLGHDRKMGCLSLSARQTDEGRAGWPQREVGAAEAAQRLGREIAQALHSKGTRLVLHFDLNKTLVMVDPAGRKTQSQVSHVHIYD